MSQKVNFLRTPTEEGLSIISYLFSTLKWCGLFGQALKQQHNMQTKGRFCLTNRGFSLVGMMVGVGILGALILGFAEFMRGSLQGQQKFIEVREISDLKNEIGMFLDSEKHCRNSLAGPGKYLESSQPFEFKKSEIGEGKEVIGLWASNQAGDNRATEQAMFYAGKEYGSLTIESIKFLIENNDGSNYTTEDGHEDIGILRVLVKKLDNNKQKFDIKLSVLMNTSSSNETTLLSCSRASSSRRCGENQKWDPKCGCISKNLIIQDIDLYHSGPRHFHPLTIRDAYADSRRGPSKNILYRPLCLVCEHGYSKNCRKCVPFCLTAHPDYGTAYWNDNQCRCIDDTPDRTP